jgi:hypothetical protein
MLIEVDSESWTGGIINPKKESDMSKKRRSFSAEFKAKVGLEALKGIEPVHVIAQ